MSKTFKSAVSERKLTIDGAYGNVTFTIIQPDGTESGLDTPSESAAAQALAILEAAGVEAKPSNDDPGTPGNLGRIAYQLMIHIEDAENIAAAEADRVKLEQEALALKNAHLVASGSKVGYRSFDDLGLTSQQLWLAVARAARELNKEDGQ